jgi:hypothetical protein
MTKLDSYLSFVKEQQGLHEKLARKFADQVWRQDLHIGTAAKFSSLAEDLILAQKQLDNFSEQASSRAIRSLDKLSLTPEDLEGLPEDLIKELSVSDADKLEFQIIGLVNDAGGVLSLDKILIGVWRKTGEVFKRPLMTSRLYRMVQKGQLFPVPGRKGIYSTEEISEAEANKMAKNSELTSSAEKVEVEAAS